MRTRFEIEAEIDRHLDSRLADGNPKHHPVDAAIAALSWVLNKREAR